MNNEEAARKIVVVALDSGTVAWVSPMSPFTQRQILKRAEVLYPLPDPKQYEQPLPDAAVEGDVIPAEMNPAYQHEVERIKAARTDYLVEVAILTHIEFPDGEAALLERFEQRLLSLRRFADLPHDDWEALVKFVLLTSKDDMSRVMQVIQERLPLTQGEVIDGMRFFRPALPGA
ncbi:MAG: hypothetical protein SF123_05870 [Chloroflexota bacterium]|nr:hypothetical protein [Chloroflexota bacterium]